MKTVSRGIVSIVVCFIFIVSFSATVSAEDEIEVFVVAAEQNGDASYMVSNGDGTFPVQENLLLMGDGGLHPMSESWLNDFHYSKGNGVGDFDNDGHFDYIMGDGIFGMTKNIYFFKKIVDGNQFASPVAVAEWSPGYYPMDMAVADFNGDGNLDFVMSYYNSPNCGLYLGDGAPESTLGFTDSLLENAAPNISAGADAADFENDGDADFVIAPMSPGESFFVNLNDGEANFTTQTFEGLKDANGDYVAYYGVAAADFDGDGVVDIAAATDGYLDIYKGTVGNDGTPVFTSTEVVSHEYDLNSSSSLDNYDFDGDGKQDLVAANFGLDGADVAILLGNGDGSFADPVIYGGGTSGVRHAVSAPPPPPSPEANMEPVAVLDPVYLEVTIGEEIVFDGSASYDDDGEIVRYEWDFGDGTLITGDTNVLSLSKAGVNTDVLSLSKAGVNTDVLSLSKAGVNTDEATPYHSYYDVGKYTVTLKVTDDKGAKASVQAEVIALPVAARIQFRPYTLYLNSRAKWIWATIRLPSGFDARKIYDPSVYLMLEDGSQIYAYSNYGRGFLAKIRKRLYRKRRALTIRFDRQDLIQKIKIPSENITLMVQGVVLDNGAWVGFEGSGKIRTIEKKKKHNFFSKYWKRYFKR